MLGVALWQLASWVLPLDPPLPCVCPQFSHQHLNEAARTLSTSTQDLGPR